MPTTAAMSMAYSPSSRPPTLSGTRGSSGLSMGAATADARASSGSPSTPKKTGRSSKSSLRSFAISGIGCLCLEGSKDAGREAAHRLMRHKRSSSTFAATGSGALGCTSITAKDCGWRDCPSRRAQACQTLPALGVASLQRRPRPRSCWSPPPMGDATYDDSRPRHDGCVVPVVGVVNVPTNRLGADRPRRSRAVLGPVGIVRSPERAGRRAARIACSGLGSTTGRLRQAR
jgi:hypothetical protein